MSSYAQIAILLALGAVLGSLPLVLPLLISPRYRGRETEDTYECGITPEGSSWLRFGVGFYVFALIFVAFEVDILYLFPISLVSAEFGWRGFIEMALFLGILSLAVVYAWRRGVFKWVH
ncbi:MAG: NADH-quinone oxidoreductase subunit A [Planctomycetes bacterium]|nr:NADH-quinone oxidoreductase subunit A [Planctomycetota bacterium]